MLLYRIPDAPSSPPRLTQHVNNGMKKMCPVFDDFEELIKNVHLVNYDPNPLISYTSFKSQIGFHYLEDTERDALDTVGYNKQLANNSFVYQSFIPKMGMSPSPPVL